MKKIMRIEINDKRERSRNLYMRKFNNVEVDFVPFKVVSICRVIDTTKENSQWQPSTIVIKSSGVEYVIHVDTKLYVLINKESPKINQIIDLLCIQNKVPHFFLT